VRQVEALVDALTDVVEGNELTVARDALINLLVRRSR
jgi:hypothetical protein